MRLVLTMIFVTLSGAVLAQNKTGIFTNAEDIGKPKKSGSTTYDASTQVYTLSGGGYNIWFGRDEFHYAYRKVKGDFILTANFEFEGKGVEVHRKVGWMVRESSEPDAAHVSATFHGGDGLTVLQWRTMRGAYMRDPQDEIRAKKKKYSILQLERVGNVFTMRAANFGEPLQVIGSQEMSTMPAEPLVGLFICSHNPDVVEQARFWNVRIERTKPEEYNAYRSGFVGSRMEIVNVADGKRKVIHEDSARFEAPNWMPDGNRLLFNHQDGSIYTIPVTGGKPEKINTGTANRNNNDHGISFDGKLLAISSHQQGLPGGGSTVYVLPVSGGTPKQVTTKTPSYWHGWNPNNKEVLLVASRGSETYDIYKTGINGGEETKLTNNAPGEHADGPEFTPDGKWIYYNASTTGTMQIWRMKPDGSGKEQITFDEYNNWFPHISPDGKWIVIISFPPTVDVNDHPFYKRVMLRLMPVNGGPLKVIAHLYGGQGTINVPSWSPDSKQIAFVSNSDKL